MILKGTRVEIVWNSGWAGHRGFVVEIIDDAKSPLRPGQLIWVKLDRVTNQIRFYRYELSPLPSLVALAEAAE